MPKTITRCYFCDTPFQILNCIHLELIRNGHTDADIYILDRFSYSEQLVERLNSQNIFRNVIWIRESDLYKPRHAYKSKLAMQLGTIKSYFRIEKIVPRFLVSNAKYDAMYFPCHILCFRLARFYFLKHKENTKFYMYDEGVGSYIGKYERIHPIDKLFRRILFGKEGIQIVFERLLYQPGLERKSSDHFAAAQKIPCIEENDKETIAVYNNVFQYFQKDAIRQTCVFFDGIRENNFVGPEAQQAIQRWYDTIETIIGCEHLIVKEHPRCQKHYPYHCERLQNCDIPSELYFMNADIENKVLITVGSTAVITPKLIFDKEPLILLLCMVNTKFYKPLPEMSEFFFRVKGMYRNPEKVFIPRNEKELSENLLVIKEQLEKEIWNV